MYSEKDTVIIYHIMTVISKLHSLGYKVDYEEGRSNASKQYKRYIKDFSKAKKVLGLSGDCTGVKMLHNPRHLFWEAYKVADNPSAILSYFGVQQFQQNLIQEFENLDNPIEFFKR